MKQALLIVLDSVGVGHAPDAAAFGDRGANTVGHIRSTVPDFAIPNLDRAGLASAEALAAGQRTSGQPTLSWGCMTEASAGKDTTTGHWEIAGAPVLEPFPTFDEFPTSLVSEMESTAGVSFIGNYARSGTAILDELGEEHLRSGRPILYTSGDSVIQIAAHEEVIPVERIYDICRACRLIADRERIGRVIARPFTGIRGSFSRTTNRRDYSLRPPRTILNLFQESGIETVGVGKIGDIFAGAGIDICHPTRDNQHGCETIETLLSDQAERARLIFANLVDFDMHYGHRRDPEGYARALERFDLWFGPFLQELDEEVLVIVTADHGNDPTWTGTDHTREQVPLLVRNHSRARCLGIREKFSDIAVSLADWFEIEASGFPGDSFFDLPEKVERSS